MRKLFCSFVLVLTIIAIFGGTKSATAANGSDTPRFAFVDSVGEFLGLQNTLAPVFSHSRSPLTGVPVSLPNVSPFQGVISVPVTTGDLTGLGVIAYEMQVTFDPAVVTPATPPFDKTGTISSGMSITPNTGFPGHLIIPAFQGTPLTGSGTLLYLRFNVIGAPGQSTALAFEDYIDPGSINHPGFRFNEGTPLSKTTNGSISVMATPTPTATNTTTPTPTNTPTAVLTNTPTNTATSTPSNTATPTFTPTNTPTATPVGTPNGVPVSLANVSPFQGVVTVPITTGDVSGLGVISYDFQVTFDPAVVTPASPPFDRTGTLSSSMLVTPNAGFPGHLIMTGFQATPLTGSGTLLYLKFNVVGAPGQSTALAFENYVDPGMSSHPAFVYNEGDPAVMRTNGSVTILATPTATNTATNTPTPTSTATFTPTSTATKTPTFTPSNTATPTNTATDTPTATNTATQTPTATNTATATPTPTAAVIRGTLTYGNAIGSPNPRFVSNVLLTADGSPAASAVTGAPGAGEGIYSLDIFGAGPYTVTPSKIGGTNTAINSFDAGKIAGHVTGISTLSGNQLIVADVSGNGLIQSFDAGLIARFVTQSGPSGLTGMWKFFTIPNVPFPPGTTPSSRTYSSITGNLTGEDYTALLMGEVSGNWNNTGARPVSSGGPERTIAVDLPRLVTPAGYEVLVPVAVEGIANKGIISYEFNLRYDPTIIQPLDDPIDIAGTVSRSLSFVANASEPGILRVAVYGPMPISENGILLNLRFKAVGKAGSVSSLIWEKIMFNDGEPQIMVTNGQVETSERP